MAVRYRKETRVLRVSFFRERRDRSDAALRLRPDSVVNVKNNDSCYGLLVIP
jgi:hypothetical protein